jgi:RNA polymerase sigma-70 factor (ECF subfamily)
MNDTPSTLHTRCSLLVRIRDAHDTASWQTFVELYGPLVYRWGRSKGLQEADAADATQEVMLQVAQSIRTFEYQPERGRFRDWLGTVARHKVERLLKKNGRAASGAGGDAADRLDQIRSPEADDEWTAAFNAHVLRMALDRIRPEFPPDVWRAFERRWLDNRSAEEVAAELGMTIQAVYVAKSRVLKRLEEEVRILAEDLPQLVPLR